MGEIEVVPADRRDIADLSGVLARAFQDDPALSHAAPDPERRRRHGPKFFAFLLRQYVPKGEVYATAGSEAVAVWAPPDRWRLPPRQLIGGASPILQASGRHTFRAIRMLSLMERKHLPVKEPHYYLGYIGTEPTKQGHGFGGALLANMTARLDREGLPAYLEASSPGNQALYFRHGFEVIEEIRWPSDGPPAWIMWRRPRG